MDASIFLPQSIQLNESIFKRFEDSLIAQPDVLSQKSLLAANCGVIANYDLKSTLSYASHQIKSDPETGELVYSHSLDVINQLSSYSKGWVTTLTTLDKTVIVLRKVFKEIVFEAVQLGTHLLTLKEDCTILRLEFLKVTGVALHVIEGIKRMYSTYSIQYPGNSHPGMTDFFILYNNVHRSAEEIKKLFLDYFKTPIDFPINDVNTFLVKQKQYYDSLLVLRSYDPKGSAEYSKHQIKAIPLSDLLVHTSRWNLNQGALFLTNLNQTAEVLKRHALRIKDTCLSYDYLLKNAENVNEEYEKRWQREIWQITWEVRPGIQRMYDTYSKQYPDGTHPGMAELKTCNESFSWMDSPAKDFPPEENQ